MAEEVRLDEDEWEDPDDIYDEMAEVVSSAVDTPFTQSLEFKHVTAIPFQDFGTKNEDDDNNNNNNDIINNNNNSNNNNDNDNNNSDNNKKHENHNNQSHIENAVARKKWKQTTDSAQDTSDGSFNLQLQQEEDQQQKGGLEDRQQEQHHENQEDQGDKREEELETDENERERTMPSSHSFGVRRYAQEDIASEQWKSHQKHVFILSSAGKPIYSRYGDESELAGLMGVMSAMVSFGEDDKNAILSINTDPHQIVFVVEGPFYLVCVSSSGESPAFLRRLLYALHEHIISTLTSGISKIFQRRAQFDVRNLLGVHSCVGAHKGTEKSLDRYIEWMENDLSFLLGSVHCLRLDKALRNLIGSILQAAKCKDLLFSILIAKQQLVNLVRPRKHVLHPVDLHLILNFVSASSMLRTSETWVPLCLPHFNDQGFLHVYVRYLADDVVLVLISTKAENFYPLAECQHAISQRFDASGVLQTLSSALQQQFYSCNEVNIASLRHFVYKSNQTAQITHPQFTAPYHSDSKKRRLLSLYEYLHHRACYDESKQHRMFYYSTQRETSLAWTARSFQLYAVFDPLTTAEECMEKSKKLLNWIHQMDASLFVLDSPVFS